MTEGSGHEAAPRRIIKRPKVIAWNRPLQHEHTHDERGEKEAGFSPRLFPK